MHLVHSIYIVLFLLCVVWSQNQPKSKPRRWKRVNDPDLDTVEIRRKRLLSTWHMIIQKNPIKKGDPNARGLYPEYFRLIKYLSALTHVENLPLDFISIGACTGINDEFIGKFFVMPHWRGVFVEPDLANFEMLQKEFSRFNEPTNSHRSYLINAAISDSCVDGQVTMYKPTNNVFADVSRNGSYGQNVSHTIVHELSSLRPELVKKAVDSIRNVNVATTAGLHTSSSVVPCLTIEELLSKANHHFTQYSTSAFSHHIKYNQSEYISFRPMTVRVDTEGHDGVVMLQYLHALESQLEEYLKNVQIAIATTTTSAAATVVPRLPGHVISDSHVTTNNNNYVPEGIQTLQHQHQQQQQQHHQPQYYKSNGVEMVAPMAAGYHNASGCGYAPLVFFWEQNKLSRNEYTALNDALHKRGYKTHEDFYPGRWLAQDMYAAQDPKSTQFLERCRNVPYEEGVFLRKKK